MNLAVPSAEGFDSALVQPGLELSGPVVAVWEHAALVRPDSGGPLLTLLHPERALVPFGIRLRWEALRVREGERAELGARRLSVGGRPFALAGPGVRLSLEPAPFSRPALEAQLAGVRLPSRTRMLLGDEGIGAEPAERAMVVAARRGLRHLLLAMTMPAVTAQDFREAVRQLSGLGPGQTPTGDDLLTGVAAAGHRLAGTGRLAGRNWSLFTRALEQLPRDSTTPVAREMLRHAAAGSFPELLLRFVAAMGDPSQGLEDAARRLEGVGAQTGTDWMAGAVALVVSVDEARGGSA